MEKKETRKTAKADKIAAAVEVTLENYSDELSKCSLEPRAWSIIEQTIRLMNEKAERERKELELQISGLKGRITDKDRTLNEVEDDYEKQLAHLRFMVNGLNDDKQRLMEQIHRQGVKNHPTFWQRLGNVFKGQE